MLHRVVDAAVFFALRCRVASLLCSCLFAMLAAVLTVACSGEGSSRCFVASLSSACPCRSVLCSMSLLFASRLLLLRCCLALMLAAVFDVVAAMQCSSRCVVDLSGSRAPCMPLRAGGALPCPVAGGGWGVGVGAVVAQGMGLGSPWDVPPSSRAV